MELAQRAHMDIRHRRHFLSSGNCGSYVMNGCYASGAQRTCFEPLYLEGATRRSHSRSRLRHERREVRPRMARPWKYLVMQIVPSQRSSMAFA